MAVDCGGWVAGAPSWDAVKMFKVLVYGKFYGNLSDERLEEVCQVNIRVKNFVGLGFLVSPDEKTIHKYRSDLAASGRMEEVFAVFRPQNPWPAKWTRRLTPTWRKS